MSKENEDFGLNKDPLFVGLTRPSLILGVSIPYFMLNILICSVYYINRSDIWILIIGFVVHMIGYIACYSEPRFMELYLLKFGKSNQCPNKSYYGANTYQP